MQPKIRITGVLVEDGKILLVKQQVFNERKWSLPGGKLEYGETIGQCLKREIKEETGLNVKLGELLYLTDRIAKDVHVIHITLTAKKISGILQKGSEPEPDAIPIEEVKMVEIEKLEQYGFTKKFAELVKKKFPHKGATKDE